ncbi:MULTISPECIES: hypothetical protein [Actinopolyspora]|uniref:Uncharacterized protein n=1 Tax=Actinopolyspora saharensis TaxID=995062 RepID=A0A1H0YC77_9ACTN|nr:MULTISPECIES: hypothetical protein [Actinopolyspora]NHD17670.1 hypothetical protein [Actinopolyspora sp. BKK2]NHE76597.1 hypothetical protein [Actinopolyspora sp. BKK1]SDQ12778.1 hypothetical protein SAMN04489718_0366 [Actinopolyspora saharensis]
MNKSLLPHWSTRELHWHAHLSTAVSASKLRRHYTPAEVLYTPNAGATWLANTIAAHSTDAVAVEWGMPWGVLIDTPGMHNDVERGEYALAHGGSVDALVLTTTGQLYLYLDPYTPTQCPDHELAGR